MKVQHPKDYLVLAYDSEVGDILLFVKRGFLTRGEAVREVQKEYTANNWGKPEKIRTINLADVDKAGFLGSARVHELPRPEPVAKVYDYTPQIEWV